MVCTSNERAGHSMNEPRLGRLRGPGHDASHVEPIELFYDVVYVLAVTQLTRHLLDDLSLRGAIETLILLLAVWAAWIHIAWLTNYLDPRERVMRVLLLALMLVSLVMSASLLEAFDGYGLAFGGALSASLLIGQTYGLIALWGRDPIGMVFERVLIWWVPVSALLVAGGLMDGSARLVAWGVAILVMYVVTATGFPLPRLGHAMTTDYPISGEHFAHRCYLFITIALGETILVIGTQFARLPRDGPTMEAFVLAFLGSAGLWWLYFDRDAEAGIGAISAAADPGRLGLWAYTFFHVPLVAGVIVSAAAFELTLAHPDSEVDVATACLMLGGAALFFFGLALFELEISRASVVPPLIAIGGLAALTPVATVATNLGLLAATTAIIAVASMSLTMRRRIAVESGAHERGLDEEAAGER